MNSRLSAATHRFRRHAHLLLQRVDFDVTIEKQVLEFVVASLQLSLTIAESVELRANLLRRETDRSPTTSTCMYCDISIFFNDIERTG